MTDFQSLIARVEAGTGPDRELNRDICVALGFVPSGFPHVLTAPRLTASLDACLALQEHVLPGTCGLLIFSQRGAAATVHTAALGENGTWFPQVATDAPNDLARAWISAILRAVSAQKEQADGGRT